MQMHNLFYSVVYNLKIKLHSNFFTLFENLRKRDRAHFQILGLILMVKTAFTKHFLQ